MRSHETNLLVIDFLDHVSTEYNYAVSKFPPEKSPTFHALIEEVGELGKALMEESRPQVYYEAVQVATMAMRLAIEGDFTISRHRIRNGLEIWGSDFAFKEAAGVSQWA